MPRYTVPFRSPSKESHIAVLVTAMDVENAIDIACDYLDSKKRDSGLNCFNDGVVSMCVNIDDWDILAGEVKIID